MRFEFAIPDFYKTMLLSALPFFLVIKLVLFCLFGYYKMTWRYVGITELNRIYVATAAAESLLMVMILIREVYFSLTHYSVLCSYLV
jgi:FlaA1/EpsC-like NDP-sugar epimerase